MVVNTTPSWDGHPLHMDTSFFSHLLNLRVSFFWRHLANEMLMDTFYDWKTPLYNSTPDIIFMGLLYSLHKSGKLVNVDLYAQL